ncbi:MAG: hypothetical protein ACD_9C00301G0002 [uncultured bacterium]|nr:MAG: hypothetical protein ACD_9C00301G0002 [uncultured bacterium]
MNKKLRSELIEIAKKVIENHDPSHDFLHAFRVLLMAEKIAISENADLDIIVPSALFHDVKNFPKNHRKRALSSSESAKFTSEILNKISTFPKNKISNVIESIESCSFSKGIMPELLEAKILQDADGLEATGAISIMRTFSSSGGMGRQFYEPNDPFVLKRNHDDSIYALDLFFSRLLQVEKRMHTKIAKKIAKRRTMFLGKFLRELEMELLEVEGK